MNITLKSTIRRLIKNWGTTLINILGLSVGFAAVILITLYVHHESSYDSFHIAADRLYQVFVQWGEHEQSWVTPPVGQKMLETFPEIEKMARFVPWDDEWLISTGESDFKVKHAMGADQELFSLLSFQFIKGNPEDALTRTKTVVLNQTTSQRIFGDKDPVGELIVVNAKDTMEITGVVKDFPTNSVVRFNMLYSIEGWFGGDQWMNHSLHTFLLLRKDASVTNLRSKMPEFTKECLDPYFRNQDGRSYEDMIATSGLYLFDFKKITDSYLTQVVSGKQTIRERLRILMLIGMAVLIIACINYTNLNTVQVITRSKEIGVRKVNGSSRMEIMGSLYLESGLIVLVSLAGGFLLVTLSIAYFNEVTQRSLDLAQLNPVWTFISIFALWLIATVLAGTYPAFSLSGIKYAFAFRGLGKNEVSSFSFRNTLTIAQFVICIALVTITLLFNKQINYITSFNLGFDPGQVLVVKDAFLTEPAPLKNAVLTLPGVETAGFTNTVPGRHFNDQGIHVKGTEPSTQFAYVLRGDYPVKQLFDLELVAGRWFSEDIEQDKTSCILNESALKNLNIQEPLQTYLDEGSWSSEEVDEVRVIGVIKDFNFQSLQNPIGSMVVYPEVNNAYLCIKLGNVNYPALVAQVRDIWEQQTGNLPFEYFFLDQDFNQNYQAEAQMRQIFLWFSILTIFVTCLGLFGISSFLILRRTKEIGIRKVNGATVAQILKLLNQGFVRWVMIAFVIACPLAYLVSVKWLENFTYKTNISWWLFLFSGMIAIVIALVTVSWQSWKAAIRNPIEALRYE